LDRVRKNIGKGKKGKIVAKETLVLSYLDIDDFSRMWMIYIEFTDNDCGRSVRFKFPM
jgi:hypothetical protein